MKLAFVCIQNAGRSQMATAFAERERERRGLDEEIDILTGGTDPADSIHDVVVEVMAERGFELDRTPTVILPIELQACDYVAAMGCTADGVCPVTWCEEGRDWDLDDPHGKPSEEVRDIRDEVERRVESLFDEVESSQRAT